MTPDVLLTKMRKQRRRQVPIDDAKSITIERPTKIEIFRSWVSFETVTDKETATLNIDTDRVHLCVVAWDGFTEADLIGAEGSADTLVPFDVELVREYLACHPDKMATVVEALRDSIFSMFSDEAATEKK